MVTVERVSIGSVGVNDIAIEKQTGSRTTSGG